MNELHEDLDRALRTLPVSEAPVERAKHDGRRRRNRRRAGVLAGALAVIAVAAGYPALAGSSATGPAAPTVGRSVPAPGTTGLTDAPPAGTFHGVDGLDARNGVVAAGTADGFQWRAIVRGQDHQCITFTTVTGTSPATTSSCQAATPPSGNDPAQLDGMSIDSVAPGSGTVTSAAGAVVGQVARDVTSLTVDFADGQRLTLYPVNADGLPFVAWVAPQSLTVASVTAHRDGRGESPTATAIPFEQGSLSVFGLWQVPGQSAPPRAHAVIGSGSSWSVTAYEGPWGTCFLVGQGESACDPSSRLDTTAFAGSTGDESGGTQFGSAAPGVQLLRFKLSNGKSLDVRPVAVGNERLFAFELNNGVLPDSWTAYNSAGRVVARGND